jgi:hypothetical protein
VIAGLVLVAVLSAQARPDVLIALARDGWAAARAAAPLGGSPESVAPPRRLVAEIDQTTEGTIWQLHGAYAHALIAAAVAAAQDEHGEMDVHLLHARSLSDRLKTSTYTAQWPKPIDDAEGELFLEVDRYADAARAFQRAGNVAAACDAYRLVAKAMDGEAVREANAFLKRCP